ncbi:MAG: hypothetical protein FJ033_07310 [Chloroflexi bacterium]|nr:hypothetical protein [Chloroflexota bacterium]
MASRALLIFLAILAILLTANEKYLEWKAARAAEEIDAPRSAAVLVPRVPSATRGPFTPHRVRVRAEVDLLLEPRPDAAKIEPLSRVPAGIFAQAVAESNGWFLLDTNLIRGWAPIDAVDEP